MVRNPRLHMSQGHSRCRSAATSTAYGRALVAYFDCNSPTPDSVGEQGCAPADGPFLHPLSGLPLGGLASVTPAQTSACITPWLGVMHAVNVCITVFPFRDAQVVSSADAAVSLAQGVEGAPTRLPLFSSMSSCGVMHAVRACAAALPFRDAQVVSSDQG